MYRIIIVDISTSLEQLFHYLNMTIFTGIVECCTHILFQKDRAIQCNTCINVDRIPIDVNKLSEHLELSVRLRCFSFSFKKLLQESLHCFNLPSEYYLSCMGKWKMLKCGNRSTKTEVRKLEEKLPISV